MDMETCSAECVATAKIANRCFDLCLAEQDVTMVAQCIRLTRECTDFCHATASALERNSPFAKQLCALCAKICHTCANECAKHAEHHEHCRKCEEACTRCAEVCELMVKALS